MQVWQCYLYINPVKERVSRRAREGNSESTSVVNFTSLETKRSVEARALARLVLKKYPYIAGCSVSISQSRYFILISPQVCCRGQIWESWCLLTNGRQFTVQNHDQLYVMVYSAHKTIHHDTTCTALKAM